LLPILIAAAVVIVAVLVIWMAIGKMRSMRLKKKFGPEYDYTLEKTGDRRVVESDLQQRQKSVLELDIQPLNEKDKIRYHDEWVEIQSEFVDDPKRSIKRANSLVTEVMIARGFPVADFEQRAAYLSVLYPDFVPNYRNAHEIAIRNEDGGAATEELRQAMINYHAMFDEILETNHIEEIKMEMAK
jgi:hypothetical protein